MLEGIRPADAGIGGRPWLVHAAGNLGGMSSLNDFSYPSGNRTRHSNKDPKDETQRRTPQCQGPTQLPWNSSHASKS